MKNEVTIHGKRFEIYLSQEEISKRIQSMGEAIAKDFLNKNLILIGVLNGATVFLSDLIRAIDLPLEIGTIRASSYIGVKSSGNVVVDRKSLPEIRDKHVILVEDIVDTGRTLDELQKVFMQMGAKSIAIATLLHKPEAFEFNYPLNYVGFEIPNKFVVGFGLDYDELGRNLPAIYQIREHEY